MTAPRGRPSLGAAVTNGPRPFRTLTIPSPASVGDGGLPRLHRPEIGGVDGSSGAALIDVNGLGPAGRAGKPIETELDGDSHRPARLRVERDRGQAALGRERRRGCDELIRAVSG